MPKGIQKTKKPIAAVPYPAVALKESNKNLQAPVKLNLSKIAHSGDFQLSDEQKQVLSLAVNSHDSIFYTGSAGTGKSVLLRVIINALKNARGFDRVAVTATTGIAALNISGMTIHSFAGIGTGQGSESELLKKINKFKLLGERWKKIDVLIVDEVSMLDGDLFDKLEGIARNIRQNSLPFGGIQLVVTGDFYQLPPISRNNTPKFCFDAKTWNKCIKYTVQLRHVFRQKEPELIEMLNEMRNGVLSVKSLNLLDRLKKEPNYPKDGIKPTELYPRNDNVNASNEAKLKEIPSKAHVWKAQDWQPPGGQIKTLTKSCLAPEELVLKRNAQVMLIKNISKDLVNGKRGVVIGFCNNANGNHYFNGEDEKLTNTDDLLPIVRFTDGLQQTVEPSEWTIEGTNGSALASRRQIPLLLAWAISIHKSQGQTLDRVKVDLGRVFEKGQAYVALSRATSANSLQVSNFNISKVMVHSKVKAFYDGLTDAANVK